MPTIRKALEFYQKAVADGKGDLHTGHPFIAEDEAAAREKNEQDPITKKKKTKIAFDSQDPDSYTEWHKERKRWMGRAQGNPTLATDAQIIRLRMATEEDIDRIIAGISEARAMLDEEHHNPLVPRANLKG